MPIEYGELRMPIVEQASYAGEVLEAMKEVSAIDADLSNVDGESDLPPADDVPIKTMSHPVFGPIDGIDVEDFWICSETAFDLWCNYTLDKLENYYEFELEKLIRSSVRKDYLAAIGAIASIVADQRSDVNEVEKTLREMIIDNSDDHNIDRLAFALDSYKTFYSVSMRMIGRLSDIGLMLQGARRA